MAGGLWCPPYLGGIQAGMALMGSGSGAMPKGVWAGSGGAGGGLQHPAHVPSMPLPAASPSLVAMVKSVVYSRGVSPGWLLSRKTCFVRKKKK